MSDSKSAEDELGDGEEQPCKAKKKNGDQILREPSNRLPLDLNARALHPLPTHRLLGQIKARPFHPQLQHTPRQRPVIVPLPVNSSGNFPEQEQLGLDQKHQNQRGG